MSFEDVRFAMGVAKAGIMVVITFADDTFDVSYSVISTLQGFPFRLTTASRMLSVISIDCFILRCNCQKNR